ncbi:cuticle protein 7-like isoform X2 [Ostrinia furnacalis]|uniref:cuticle protein 7-like isoform X2 n=1 Tax=Ostrinia furnacalis TaxID=93504 RepID=UPI00103E8728|nr:cuticle protein 7-like isoform X2 [Ostrinia furnacalis]
MLAKVVLLCCACAGALAAPGIYGGVGYAAPAYAAHVAPAIAAPAIAHYAAPAIAAPVIRAEPVDPNPAYSFSYGVSDPHTGDQKDQQETLQNGVVHGSYSLVEPDGHLRRVTYTADKINGFNAVVERTGGAHAAPVAVAPVAKVIAAPAPVAVAAPVARYTLPVAAAHPWG